MTDLSQLGCQLVVRTGILQDGQHVVIRFKGVEGLPGKVKWVWNKIVGIEFDRPIHEAIVDFLFNPPAISDAADYGFVDQYGRKLPPLSKSTPYSASNRRPCS